MTKKEVAAMKQVAFGDKFAPGLLAKARKAVDETMKQFREEKSHV